MNTCSTIKGAVWQRELWPLKAGIARNIDEDIIVKAS
jgi:hypothetical protein